MRFLTTIVALLLIGAVAPAQAGFLDAFKRLVSPESSDTSIPDENATIAALRQALTIGTENAVRSVARTDGYLGNEMIKIILPERIQRVVDMASAIGLQPQVDHLVVTMNRAAEAAAPKATELFVTAIREMTFEDARGIVEGGETSATDFFRKKTGDRLYGSFKPVVTSSMEEVGVARAYKDLVTPLASVPMLQTEWLDLDHYVTNQALDGLFQMVAVEERKIRSDPAARVTDLLRKVFGQ
ncbi:MAG: DUF4197 domain-containing protein [Desulfatitalea sp.]|nr:DUF4197 domain-containing protein [Desulfatitalea sp.]